MLSQEIEEEDNVTVSAVPLAQGVKPAVVLDASLKTAPIAQEGQDEDLEASEQAQLITLLDQEVDIRELEAELSSLQTLHDSLSGHLAAHQCEQQSNLVIPSSATEEGIPQDKNTQSTQALLERLSMASVRGDGDYDEGSEGGVIDDKVEADEGQISQTDQVAGGMAYNEMEIASSIHQVQEYMVQLSMAADAAASPDERHEYLKLYLTLEKQLDELLEVQKQVNYYKSLVGEKENRLKMLDQNDNEPIAETAPVKEIDAGVPVAEEDPSSRVTSASLLSKMHSKNGQLLKTIYAQNANRPAFLNRILSKVILLSQSEMGRELLDCHLAEMMEMLSIVDQPEINEQEAPFAASEDKSVIAGHSHHHHHVHGSSCSHTNHQNEEAAPLTTSNISVDFPNILNDFLSVVSASEWTLPILLDLKLIILSCVHNSITIARGGDAQLQEENMLWVDKIRPLLDQALDMFVGMPVASTSGMLRNIVLDIVERVSQVFEASAVNLDSGAQNEDDEEDEEEEEEGQNEDEEQEEIDDEAEEEGEVLKSDKSLPVTPIASETPGA